MDQICGQYGFCKVTQYRKEVVPSAQKSEAKKMLKNRLTLTIFGRFLEGNLNFNHIWTAQFHFDHIWTAQYIRCGQSQISLQKPSKYGQSKPIFEQFFGFTFFPWWWASALTQDCFPRAPSKRQRGSTPCRRARR